MAKSNKKHVNQYPKEEIPNGDILFMRVHKNNMIENEPAPVAFKNTGGIDACSSDWKKYSSALDTKNRVVLNGKNPDNYRVIKLIVRDIKNIPQEVEHTPSKDNRSHTSIWGEKSTEVRLKFLDIYEWAKTN